MITFGYKSKFSSILRACAAIGIGLVMIISTNATEMVVRIIAAFLFAAGMMSLVYGYTKRKEGAFSLMSVNAVVDVVIGLLLFFFPAQVSHFIIYLIGFALLIFGLLQVLVLSGTLSLVGGGIFSLILSGAALVCGIVLVFNPFSQAIMGIIAGVALMSYGFSELLSAWRVNKAVEAYEIKFGKKDVEPEAETVSEEITFTADSLSDAKEVDYEKVDEQ